MYEYLQCLQLIIVHLEMNFIKRVDNAKEDESWLVDRIRFRSHIIGPNAETLYIRSSTVVLVLNEYSVTVNSFIILAMYIQMQAGSDTGKAAQAHLLGIALLECARRCTARSNRCRSCMRVARHCSGEQRSSANVA